MIPFVKMHGIGNDFVMLDTLRDGSPSGDLAELSRRLCDRRFGIGGDGLILVERAEEAPFRMRMFNPDGSESEMCGNGIRCFARLLADRGYAGEGAVPVVTGAGVLTVEILADGQVRVDMGPYRLKRGEIGITGNPDEEFREQPVGGYVGTAVSMGNPHLVIYRDDASKIDLEFEGPKLEHDRLFPRRINVHFAQVESRTQLVQRTWERGAGVTLACGTGACAVAVAGFLTGRSERKVAVRLPGGSLEIDVREDGRVLMTGPAVTVFEGTWTA